jgi:glycosyltransferase involved in cell wall biosynthesis
VGHIAGVLNNLQHFSGAPLFLTSDSIPTVDPKIRACVVAPEPVFLNNSELASMRYNRTFLRRALAELGGQAPAFVYQRYCGNNYSGLELARHFNVPFVLEYNGSESWVSRNWGEARRYEAITDRIELLNLQSADLVVVVSRALRDELVGRGVDEARILINPNGVDPQAYSPQIDGAPVRERYALADRIVFGFIGTFGRWHGTEVLIEAYARLLAQHPTQRQSTRVMLIGDGSQMPAVQQAIERHQLREQVILTGLVPQQQGPAHMAACDVLVSPHVPNPDGTPFFGSPTKLFEYMAMGRGIVASRLDQIAEILRHDHTAWLVDPGCAASLASGMQVLLTDPSRRSRLGTSARQEAVSQYTWRRHTQRIVERLHALTSHTQAQAA